MSKNITFDLIAKDRASSSFRSAGDSADRSARRIQAAGRIAKLGALAFVAGTGAVVIGAGKLVKAAAEDEVSVRLMAKQFRNSAGATREQIAATEEWITKQGIAKGVADDQLRPALSTLIRATGDVGKAQKLTSTAMNVSAITGKDLGTVSTALAKAYNGNVGALGKLGIKTKDAQGKTKDFAAIQRDLADQFGGAATAKANTFTGKMDRLKVVLSEAGESIGYKLLPVVSDLATWFLQKGVPAISTFSDWIGDKLGSKVKASSGFFTGTLVPAFRSAWGFIQNNLIPTLRDLADKWLGAVSKGVSKIKPHLKSLGPTIDLVSAAFKGVWNVISKVLLPVLGKVYQTVFPALGTAIGVVIEVVGALSKAAIWLWNKAFQPSLKLIVGGIGSVITVFGKMLGALSKVPGFGWVKGAARDLKAAGGATSALADSLKKIPKSTNTKVNVSKGSGWSLFDNLADKLHQLAGGGGGGGGGKGGKGTRVIGRVMGSALADGAAEAARKGGEKVTEKLGEGMAKKAAKLKDRLGKVLDMVRDQISDSVSKFSDLKSLRADFLGTFKADSALGTDLSGGGGFGAILANQLKTESRASAFGSNLQSLLNKGLSKSLVGQLREQGFGAADQVAALNSASAAQIAILNASDQRTAASLAVAGIRSGNYVRGGSIDTDIARAQNKLDMQQALEAALKNVGLKGKLEIDAAGQKITALLNAYQRNVGKQR